jgi:hypothetical protein
VDTSRMTVDIRPGDVVRFSPGTELSIELMRKSGNLARLKIIASRDVKIEKITQSYVPSMAR